MAETREEQYLAKISGEDVAIPDPITRKEKYLYNIAKKPGGGASTWDELGTSHTGEIIPVPEKYLPEDYIKGLITEELGVIENGTY